MKNLLIPLFAFAFGLRLFGATNLVSNTAIVTNRVQGIVTYTMSNGVARVQDPSGKLVGTAEERALKVAADGQIDIASAAADAAGTAMEEWREFTATTDVKVVYIDAGFTQDLPALAPNLCGWVAGSLYDREKGEDHYYVWFNREMDAPPSMCARIVSESGTNWLDGAWKDWAVTNWIDKATGREFVMPTARDYVQDSAFVFWDGIENAGLGLPHDPLATQIADLSGNGNNLPNTNMTIGESGFSLSGSSAQVDIPPKQYEQMTVEILIDVNTQKEYNFLWFSMESNARGMLVCTGVATSIYRQYYIPWYDVFGSVRNPSVGTRLFTFCWKDGEQKLYFDGIQVAEGTSSLNRTYNTLTRLFLNNYNGSSSRDPLTFSRVTLHDAYLTDEQIATNYAIDAVRFNLEPLDHFVPCRELVVPRRNANCVLKTGTVITFGGKDGFDADIHKVNIEVGGTPTVTTSAQLPLFYAVTRSGTNTVTRAYTNGFLNVENGFIKEPTNE